MLIHPSRLTRLEDFMPGEIELDPDGLPPKQVTRLDENSHTIKLRVPSSEYAKLKVMADSHGITPSRMIRKIIRQRIQRIG